MLIENFFEKLFPPQSRDPAPLFPVVRGGEQLDCLGETRALGLGRCGEVGGGG